MKDKAFKKIFFLGLFIILGRFCFGQHINRDDEIIQRYAITSAEPAFNKQHTVFLVKVKAGNATLHKQQYKDQIILQLNADWFIVKAGEGVLNKQELFQKILPANNNYKLSGAFFTDNTLNRHSAYSFIIKVSDKVDPAEYLQAYHLSIRHSYNINFFILKARLSFITDTLINNADVLSADIILQQPKEEMVINDYDNSVNAINLFFSKYPGINGEGLSVSVKENLFDTTDIDFKNRYQRTSDVSSEITTHATIIATLIGGGGNSFYTGKGIAWGTQISSSDFTNLLPDSDSSYTRYKTSVQNHSYGTAIENFYGTDANAFDQAVINNPHLVYVFSAGNSGVLTGGDGRYKNLTGFANITGNFKQAKNIIVVGSIDSFYHVPVASSKGPAYDGRIKPELVAYGNDGSSGAAAITSGTALAVQSAYAKLHHDSLPPNALVKAILINSADDVYNAGPDYYSGYGNVNVYKAIRDINSVNYFRGNARQNHTDSFTISIPSNTKNLKITLTWNDEPAPANSFTALVNDLDMEVKNKRTNEVWLPWVLNSNPDSALLLALPQRRRDSLNVIEQITISQPVKGDYIIYVKGYNVTTASQPYYVVYEMETADRFQFVSPAADDHFTPGSKGIIRWNETYNNANGKLEYSTDAGLNWQVIDNAVSLNDNYYMWQVPDTTAIALVRITIGNDVYTSDTFDLSQQLSPRVIINCGDSVLISWNKIKGTDHYKILRLGKKYLLEYIDVNDTSIVIKNSVSSYIAVAPVFDNGRTGLKSYTFNFNTQGAGCYINYFLADLTADNKADLHLTLGTTTGIDSVQFQQFIHDNWQTLATVYSITNTEVHYLYDSLLNGINIFRSIVWVNGDELISNTASIYYFMNVDFIVKPNPLPQGESLTILSSTLVSGTLVIYDVLGRKLLQQEIINTENNIKTGSLSRGVYFLVIYDNKQKVYKSKLIIE